MYISVRNLSRYCTLAVVLGSVPLGINGIQDAAASCGSAACFLLTGEESTVQLKGALSVGIQYAYTISKLESGTNGFVSSAM